MIDENTVVRVCRYIKTVTGRNPVTNMRETRTIHLDWGIGRADGASGLYTYGPPTQVYASGFGDPITDSRVHIVDEFLPQSSLPSTAAGGYGTDTLHFKHPNI
ncbi:MAG TPA: hypothetical protein VEA38_00965 [Terriglobales bacterium]|nr:hypothetical protein [Terriglobales bacterium]